MAREIRHIFPSRQSASHPSRPSRPIARQAEPSYATRMVLMMCSSFSVPCLSVRLMPHRSVSIRTTRKITSQMPMRRPVSPPMAKGRSGGWPGPPTTWTLPCWMMLWPAAVTYCCMAWLMRVPNGFSPMETEGEGVSREAIVVWISGGRATCVVSLMGMGRDSEATMERLGCRAVLMARMDRRGILRFSSVPYAFTILLRGQSALSTSSSLSQSQSLSQSLSSIPLSL
mmetsp:Transcript_5806/g.13897  ORF Transcript_5806/g.13897 Transcript_5806/m.13897 type:complete len:228 (+) Transcript_5806:200-883(+)